MAELKTNCLIALDVETASYNLPSSDDDTDIYCFAVGICAANPFTSEIILKKRWACLPDPLLDSADSTRGCVDQPGLLLNIPSAIRPFFHDGACTFWGKHEDVLIDLLKDPKAPATVWAELHACLANLYERFPNPTLLTDCSDFDIPIISDRVARYVPASRRGIRYHNNKRIANVIDVSSLALALTKQEDDRINSIIDASVAHTHYPDDDAECIVRKFILTAKTRGITITA